MNQAMNGGPAFPGAGPAHPQPAGMTLLEYFAGKALSGLIAQSGGTAFGSEYADGAQYAYKMADAMLAERNRRAGIDQLSDIDLALAAVLLRMDGYMDNSGYGADHPWRTEIRAALAASGVA